MISPDSAALSEVSFAHAQEGRDQEGGAERERHTGQEFEVVELEGRATLLGTQRVLLARASFGIVHAEDPRA